MVGDLLYIVGQAVPAAALGTAPDAAAAKYVLHLWYNCIQLYHVARVCQEETGNILAKWVKKQPPCGRLWRISPARGTKGISQAEQQIKNGKAATKSGGVELLPQVFAHQDLQ
jgi:hypothetical protein